MKVAAAAELASYTGRGCGTGCTRMIKDPRHRLRHRRMTSWPRCSIGWPGGGLLLLRIHRLRLADGEPMSIDTSHLPRRRFPGACDGSWNGTRRFTRRSAPATASSPAEAEETIETVLADPHDAGLLDVYPGIPLLLVSRHAIDSTGEPVEGAPVVVPGRPPQVHHLAAPHVAGTLDAVTEPGTKRHPVRHRHSALGSGEGLVATAAVAAAGPRRQAAGAVVKPAQTGVHDGPRQAIPRTRKPSPGWPPSPTPTSWPGALRPCCPREAAARVVRGGSGWISAGPPGSSTPAPPPGTWCWWRSRAGCWSAITPGRPHAG